MNGKMSAARSIMPALLALIITSVWGYLVISGQTPPESVGNAEFTVLAFYFGSRMAETRGPLASNGTRPSA